MVNMLLPVELRGDSELRVSGTIVSVIAGHSQIVSYRCDGTVDDYGSTLYLLPVNKEWNKEGSILSLPCLDDRALCHQRTFSS